MRQGGELGSTSLISQGAAGASRTQELEEAELQKESYASRELHGATKANPSISSISIY